MEDFKKLKFRYYKKKIGAFLVLIILLFFNPFVFIQSHEKGLKFTMGAISNKVLDNGLHFRIPIFQKIKTVTIQPLQKDSQIEVGSDGAITKDNQTIGATMTVFYVYKQEELTNMWKDFGIEKIENLVTSAIKESFKSNIGVFAIFEIPLNQESIRIKTLQLAKEKLAKYPINITELRVTNYDWSDEFDRQIQATMQKAQEVKQKEQELKITELETQKAVKKAEADKQSTITIAEGEKEATKLRAEAKALEGEGIRKFNESIRATQDIEIKLRQLSIESQRIEKWNGEYVPNNNYGPIPVSTGNIQGKN